VTIRVQTLQGTPRVWIEAGGIDYIASDYDAANPLKVPTDSSLYGGMLRGGAAKPVGKSTFGQFAGHNLYPLGGNEFLAGPPQQTFAGAVQLVTVKGKSASGNTFSPWQDPTYDITGVHDVLYSGLVQNGTDENGAPIYKKRFHVIYRWVRQHAVTNYGVYGAYTQSVQQAAISTTTDGGATFSTTIFNISIFATTLTPDIWGYSGDGRLEDVYIESAVFCGNNRIALIGRAIGSWGEPTGAREHIGSRITLTSADGGATWALNLEPQVEGAGFDTRALTCAYIGGSKVLGVRTQVGGAPALRETYLSNDYGATFALVEGPTTGTVDAGFADVVCLGPDNAAFFRLGNFYRTSDAGLSWETIPVPAEVNNFEPGRIVLRNTPALPDPPPDPPKPVADYAQIVMLTAVGTTDQIALSDDGGKTWKKGGIIPKRVPNVGLIDRKLPAFPVFPDLHKNGLTIP
jgi:hypothetical protein